MYLCSTLNQDFNQRNLNYQVLFKLRSKQQYFKRMHLYHRVPQTHYYRLANQLRYTSMMKKLNLLNLMMI